MPIALWRLRISRRLRSTTASIFRRRRGTTSAFIRNATGNRLRPKPLRRASANARREHACGTRLDTPLRRSYTPARHELLSGGTPMSKLPLVVFLIAASATSSFAQDHGQNHGPKLTPQQSGTTQLLIAVSPVDSRVVWAAGTGGTFVVTTNGGDTWTSGVVPGAENDQFRDVQGVSDKVAYLMSIGNNTTDFKIYKTVDGGANWTIEFTNETANAFYDCMAFWGPHRGIAHSDSVNGVFPDIRTTD